MQAPFPLISFLLAPSDILNVWGYSTFVLCFHFKNQTALLCVEKVHSLNLGISVKFSWLWECNFGVESILLLLWSILILFVILRKLAFAYLWPFARLQCLLRWASIILELGHSKIIRIPQFLQKGHFSHIVCQKQKESLFFPEYEIMISILLTCERRILVWYEILCLNKLKALPLLRSRIEVLSQKQTTFSKCSLHSILCYGTWCKNSRYLFKHRCQATWKRKNPCYANKMQQ